MEKKIKKRRIKKQQTSSQHSDTFEAIKKMLIESEMEEIEKKKSFKNSLNFSEKELEDIQVLTSEEGKNLLNEIYVTT